LFFLLNKPSAIQQGAFFVFDQLGQAQKKVRTNNLPSLISSYGKKGVFLPRVHFFTNKHNILFIMQIKNHLLEGTGVQFEETPNQSGEFKAEDLDTIIIHYTAGPSAKSAIRTLTSPKVKASAHLVIDRDGSIIQLAPFNIITWHAGKSAYQGRTGFNKYAIGIELVNAGPLDKSGSKYRAWYGTKYGDDDVIEAVHRNQTRPKYWQTYTEEQIEVTKELCELLIDAYNIVHVLGHEEISPKRKQDPGPAFPLDKLRDHLMQGGRDHDDDEDTPEEGRVTVSKLNIRSKPKTGEKVANALTKDQKVRILDEKDGWYRVSTEVEGWVYGKYIGFD